MYEGQTVFSQIIDFMPKYKFRQWGIRGDPGDPGRTSDYKSPNP